METAYAVKAENLVKEYGRARAVDGISFAVAPGEFYGLLGPNGAGKTTTVRMAYGYMPPTSGTLEVLGRDVVKERRIVAAMTGVCQQDNNLDPDLTVRENLLVFARYFDIPGREASRRADELLEFIALENKRDASVSELSGGMARRLVLARALLNKPSLLILDEPTTGLDPQSRHQLWDKLRALKAEGLTVLITTHYMDEAERLCDRLLIMDEGKILVEGPPAGLISRYVGGQVVEITEPSPELTEYIKKSGIKAEASGERLIIHSNAGAEAFREISETYCSGSCMLRAATLEDVFLSLTGRDLRE